MSRDFALSCPVPISKYPRVMLAHGGGGRLMQDLIESMFIKAFSNDTLSEQTDSAVFQVPKGRQAFTTDSYVIHPIFFPGGDIGSLAVHGTVNDLSMSGARPLYLSAGFIIEEGLKMEDLWRVVSSMAEAARKCGVQIITGDTKVVDKGKGDGLYINTAGVGVLEHELQISPSSIKEGDVLIINGDIARHGIAIMTVREGLEFENVIESDSAPLNRIVSDLLSAGIEIHCMRDLTRGGMSSTLNELSAACGQRIRIDEAAIPVHEDVAGACELLGFDPLYVANEGRFALFVPIAEADKCLEILRNHPDGKDAAVVGEVLKEKGPRVLLKSRIGTERIVDMLSGEQLPRIC